MKTYYTCLILLLFAASGASYYYTEYKREYKVLRVLNDSARVVQYKKLQYHRVSIERLRCGEFLETAYVYAANCKDLDDCIQFLLFKEELYNNINYYDNDKHF